MIVQVVPAHWIESRFVAYQFQNNETEIHKLLFRKSPGIVLKYFVVTYFLIFKSQ